MKATFFTLLLLLAVILSSLAQKPILQEDLALKYLVQLPSEKIPHAQVVILLHGYGADEKDLFELRAAFPKKYLVVAARAPYSLPGGGYQWYESAMTNGQREGRKEDLDNSRGKIEKFIADIVAKYKADPKEVYLIGFSQGAIMSYEVGLTAPQTVKGVGVLSGMIFPTLKPEIKNTVDLKKLKIFVSHGTADNRIPFADGKAAADYLKSIGLTLAFHQYTGMGHTISKEVLNDLLKWLN